MYCIWNALTNLFRVCQFCGWRLKIYGVRLLHILTYTETLYCCQSSQLVNIKLKKIFPFHHQQMEIPFSIKP